MAETLIYPDNEEQRLKALRRYQILDTPPDGSFDHLTRLASTLFNMPIAIISLVDESRIWFKSHEGIDADQIDRVPGLCASAILSDELYVVEDAVKDPRTLANPLVAGKFGLKFYAAAPLKTSDGYNLGTFCIIDKQQRYLTEPQKEILKRLADIVVDEMELRLSARKFYEETHQHLKQTISTMEALPQKAQNDEIKLLLKNSRRLIKEVKDKLNN